MAKIIPITEHYQHFLAEIKEFLGRTVRSDETGLEAAFGGGFKAAAGPIRGTGCGGTAHATCWPSCAARGESGGLGRSARDLYRRGLEGKQLGLIARRLPRIDGADSDRLSAGTASALLGAQNAEYSGESTEVGL
jgi:hypothetical protein